MLVKQQQPASFTLLAVVTASCAAASAFASEVDIVLGQIRLDRRPHYCLEVVDEVLIPP